MTPRLSGQDNSPREKLFALFPALEVRDFRLFWSGWLVSQLGSQMQSLAQGWLVLTLSNSAWWLGVVGFLGSVPALLISPIAGALGDRAQRRRVLFATQSFHMCWAFLLAGLTLTGHVRLWQIVAIALLNGITFAVDAPVRQAYVPTLAGMKNLMNAIGLNSMAFNAARVLGPALAGILIGPIGAGGCFFLNGVSFLALLLALARIRPEAQTAGLDTEKPLWDYLLQGFRYLWRRRELLFLVAQMAVVWIFATFYITLLPVFARDIFQAGPRGLGILASSAGIGALVGAVLASQFHRVRRKGRVIIASCLGFSVALLALGLTTTIASAAAALSLAGLSLVLSGTTSNVLIQTSAEESLRGRVVGVYMVAAIGLGPFGALLAGGLASALGAQAAVGLAGAICAGSTLLALLICPGLLRLRG